MVAFAATFSARAQRIEVTGSAGSERFGKTITVLTNGNYVVADPFWSNAIIAETGTDLHQFSSAAHFTSWLGLAPNTKVSGGKVLSSRTPKRRNRAASAFRQAANAIGRSKQHPLKPFFHNVELNLKPEDIFAKAA